MRRVQGIEVTDGGSRIAVADRPEKPFNRWWQYAVVRGSGLPMTIDGRWFDLDDPAFQAHGGEGPFIDGTFTATNQWERREDGEVAVVYAWTGAGGLPIRSPHVRALQALDDLEAALRDMPIHSPRFTSPMTVGDQGAQLLASLRHLLGQLAVLVGGTPQ